MTAFYYRRIDVRAGNRKIHFPVNDEFEDIDKGNPVVLLHMVLQECKDFEEAEDYLVWAKDMGLNASDESVRQIHFEIRELVPQIYQIVGKEVKPISRWDVEMNTGVMKALRSAKLDRK